AAVAGAGEEPVGALPAVAGPAAGSAEAEPGEPDPGEAVPRAVGPGWAVIGPPPRVSLPTRIPRVRPPPHRAHDVSAGWGTGPPVAGPSSPRVRVRRGGTGSSGS